MDLAHAHLPRTDQVRVFVCDDVAGYRHFLRSALEIETGISVVGEAADARSCLTRIATSRPDVVLLDISMPVDGDAGDGLWAIPRIRATIPEGTAVVLRGSAITGTRWKDGQPFDHDGRSDIPAPCRKRPQRQKYCKLIVRKPLPGECNSSRLRDKVNSLSQLFVLGAMLTNKKTIHIECSRAENPRSAGRTGRITGPCASL